MCFWELCSWIIAVIPGLIPPVHGCCTLLVYPCIFSLEATSTYTLLVHYPLNLLYLIPNTFFFFFYVTKHGSPITNITFFDVGEYVLPLSHIFTLFDKVVAVFVFLLLQIMSFFLLLTPDTIPD